MKNPIRFTSQAIKWPNIQASRQPSVPPIAASTYESMESTSYLYYYEFPCTTYVVASCAVSGAPTTIISRHRPETNGDDTLLLEK